MYIYICTHLNECICVCAFLWVFYPRFADLKGNEDIQKDFSVLLPLPQVDINHALLFSSQLHSQDHRMSCGQCSAAKPLPSSFLSQAGGRAKSSIWIPALHLSCHVTNGCDRAEWRSLPSRPSQGSSGRDSFDLCLCRTHRRQKTASRVIEWTWQADPAVLLSAGGGRADPRSRTGQVPGTRS